MEADLREYLKAHPREDNLESVVVPIMLYSDSSHLADFGMASMWPFYFVIGNQSKYTRTLPNKFSVFHLAYIQSVHFYLQILRDITDNITAAEGNPKRVHANIKIACLVGFTYPFEA
jgi:hypothetical protein